MTLSKALSVVVGCTVVGGSVGTMLGYVVGRYAPSAYRVIFAHQMAMNPDFSTREIGIGLGLIDGTMIGTAVGVLVVAIVAWYEVGTRKSNL